jgi:hypothetical protein
MQAAINEPLPPSPAEREFRDWLEAQPPLKPLPPLADLDTRLRLKERRIEAAKRKRRKAAGRGGVPPGEVVADIMGKLFP